MSQENVERWREGLDAFNRRDRAAWLAACDPKVEWSPPAEWPESATVQGAAAVWDFMIEVNEPWKDGAYEEVELIDAGNDRIAIRMSRPVRGTTSGIDAEFEYWCIATFRDGRVLRLDWFSDRADALEAAGLRD